MTKPAKQPGRPEPSGAPVGRRTVLGLLALGAAGVVGGHRLQDAMARALAPIEQHDPTGLTTLIPLGDTFRFYSVTGSVSSPSADTYRLGVTGLVQHDASYTLSELQAMPQTSFVRDFQCVTGWQVPDVHWSGVRLSEVLDRVQPTATATAVRFHSFDGTYTESLPLAVARRSDVLVALRMLGKPVTHDHGGPVRMYAAEMYGYKSTKWLSGIELTHGEVAGYWEHRGYDIDGFIKR
ncbi:MAG: molybdopterin-dependent oxidoreductase [Jatrophihabitans sp.]